MIGLRRSARLATRTPVSYSKYFNDSDSDSDTYKPNTDALNITNKSDWECNNSVALTNIYLRGAINIVNNYLNECQNTRGTENKCIVIKKLFEYLVANPELCIINPRFRFIVKMKINEIKNQLNAYKDEFVLDDETKKIIDVMTEVKNKIHHSEYEDALKSSLSDIKNIFYSYSYYIQNEPIIHSLNAMEKTLEDIKLHPEYVKDSYGN